MSARLDLGLTAKGAASGTTGGCGSGGGCACGGHDAHAGHSTGGTAFAAAVATQTFGVAGMTCEHCVRSVTEELAAYPEVAAVDVSLVPGGVSRVTVGSSRPLGREEIAAAVADAGYRLSPLD